MKKILIILFFVALLIPASGFVQLQSSSTTFTNITVYECVTFGSSNSRICVDENNTINYIAVK